MFGFNKPKQIVLQVLGRERTSDKLLGGADCFLNVAMESTVGAGPVVKIAELGAARRPFTVRKTD